MEKTFGRWRIILTKKGELLGWSDSRIWESDDPLVEFEDTKGLIPKISPQYYLSTILDRKKGHSLNLHGGLPDRVVDAETMDSIIDWLEEINRG